MQLEGSLFNSQVDGLVGIEECLDYDLNTILGSKKSRKRKVEPVEEEVEPPRNKRKTTPELVLESTEKGLPKKNKVKKQKLKATAKTTNGVSDDFSPSKQGTTGQALAKSKNKFCKPSSDAPDAKCADNTAPATSTKKKKSRKSSSDVSSEQSEDADVQDVQAWNSFGLPKPLLEAIKEQGFKEPTPIQTLTLPAAVLGRRDILGAAETGSGKTLAFGLPILTGILKLKELSSNNQGDLDALDETSSDSGDENEIINGEESVDAGAGIGCVKVVKNIQLNAPTQKKPLYALILTPTRELAIQVKNHLVVAAKYTGIKIAVVVGGMAVVKQERVLNKGPEIVVATPGRLWELVQEGNAHLSQIDDVRFLAIDETDRMIERGHFRELHDILERLNADEHKRKQRQNFVFSATLTLVHELPRHLAVKKKIKSRFRKKIAKMTPLQKLQQIIEMLGISDPKVVDVTQKSGTAETLTECRITCAIDEKDAYVYYFLQRHPGRTLIFCNSIGCVKRLTTLLGLLGCSPLALHASMQQRQRLKNLDRFRDNENGILIATDVAARGLDIPCVEHVLHYQTPRTSEGYIHRSGRTARASRQGITVLLVEPAELQHYLQMCRTLGRTQDLPLFPIQESMLNAVKQRVKLACQLDKLDLHVRKANSESGWIQKAAEEMDILIDDNVSMKYDAKEARAAKRAAEIKRKQLSELLSKPLFARGFSGKYPLAMVQADMPFESAEPKSEKAVDVLKKSVDNYTKAFRKKAKWLFKPKSWEDPQSKGAPQVAEKKNKRNKKRNK